MSTRSCRSCCRKSLQLGPGRDGGIDARIGTGLIGTDRDEIAVVLVGGEQLLEQPRLLQLRGSTMSCITRLIEASTSMAGYCPDFGNLARQHDVSIEDGARAVGNGILLVVAFGEHGVERRDRADIRRGVARALHQLRQAREYRGRIALGGGRLADGEADLALRLGVIASANP